MGNTPVKIGVRLDQSTSRGVEAGSALSGKIYLSISGQPQQATGVHLVLHGEEISTIAKKDHHNNNNNHNNTFDVDRASAEVIHTDVAIAAFSGGIIPPGQYEYPFRWPLPLHLPSSMYCNQGESSCQVRYHLTAYLANSASFSVLPDHHSSTVDVSIIAASKHQKEPFNMDLDEFPIRACCANKGVICLGWDADTTVLSPSSDINIGFIGKNSSIVDVLRLRAKLVENIIWKANGRHHQLSRVLAESKLHSARLNQLWQPISKDQLHRQRRNRHHWTHHDYDTIERQTSNQHRMTTRMTVPFDARDTHKGKLVTVRHSLAITAITSGGCCVTSPESSVLVRVQRRALSSPEPVVAEAATAVAAAVAAEVPMMATAEILPDNWSPQEADVIVIPAMNIISAGAAATTVARATPIHASASIVDYMEASCEDNDNNNTMKMTPSIPQEKLLKESHQMATSLNELQMTLQASDRPLTALERQLSNPQIVAMIQNMSPHEFLQTLQAIRQQQPQVARQLAAVMIPNFYCRHVLACLWGLPQNVRFEVLKEIAPLASDLDTQLSSVERELDRQELQHFRAALK
eukprot:CAMPEP_0202460064 /NCGR_PEP_ID=MMETSP1360-20130828/41262_1 /ASSEMBLY_ACC=CAM_ASM_000848 /TAXON_ID=515479 /ORGANISM="Licmophora paradoxa, Strain CCMP2313" /LENGTH=577 /DNA_ID=CAMNT_0049081535 /DNA_START=137 /DNA_END=1870 /DNA_ORIENTATION=+